MEGEFTYIQMISPALLGIDESGDCNYLNGDDDNNHDDIIIHQLLIIIKMRSDNICLLLDKLILSIIVLISFVMIVT